MTFFIMDHNFLYLFTFKDVKDDLQDLSFSESDDEEDEDFVPFRKILESKGI